MDLVVPKSSLTRSHGCLYEPSDNHRDSSQYVGFEQMWQNNNYQLEVCILLQYYVHYIWNYNALW